MKEFLFILIIGLILISGCEVPSNLSDIKSTVKTKVQSSVEQDPSIKSCLNEIEEESRIAKEKAITDLDIKVKEYQKFDNTDSAIEYLKEWDYVLEDSMNNIRLPEFFEWGNKKIIYGDNIIIVLVRFDYYYQGDRMGLLQPIVCIDGKLHDQAKERFRVM